MTFVPTAEQQAIIGEELKSQCVIACAGSGKTMTAVRRMMEIRQRMERHRGYVALLSYSNIAVDTFRKEFSLLAKTNPSLSDRVLICTVDSFMSTHILLPHGPRVMNCACRPFLVRGTEPFLNSFKVFNGDRNVDIEHLRVSIEANNFSFVETSIYGNAKKLKTQHATSAIAKLGKVGAYTHDLGRYWSIVALLEEERLTKILACRYPHILIDEAQDIGSMHEMLLSALRDAGSTISLIGDPNQAIYEFADADGRFLREFDGDGVVKHRITENRRSVQQIVAAANAIIASNSKSIREATVRKHGAYYLFYEEDKLESLVDTFATILKANSYRKQDSAILCRGNELVVKIADGGEEKGQGATEKFAYAAILRDKSGDVAASFEQALDGVLMLLDNPPEKLRHEVLSTSAPDKAKALRRIIWDFLRNNTTGIPSATLAAKNKWHPLLKARMPGLLQSIEDACSVNRINTWGNRLRTTKLAEAPLLKNDLASEDISGIRTQTVHKVKGESIDAVLYIVKKFDLKKLLDGPSTEAGRIGYVAVTRAKDLLILAVPTSTEESQIANLESKGFLAWT